MIRGDVKPLGLFVSVFPIGGIRVGLKTENELAGKERNG